MSLKTLWHFRLNPTSNKLELLGKEQPTFYMYTS